MTSAPGTGRLLRGHRVRRAAGTVAFLALCLPPAIVLLSVFLRPDAAWTVRVALAAFCLLAIARPGAAFLVTVAFIGFGPILGILAGVRTLRATEVLVVACLAGYCVRSLSPGSACRRALGGSLSVAVVLFAATAIASMAVWLRIEQLQVGYAAAYLRELFRYSSREYFVDAGMFGLLLSTAVILEGLALYAVAAALCRVDATFFDRALRMLVVGGAALGLMSAVRLGEIAFRPGAIAALRASANGLRISPQIPDYIAAGSYFGLCWVAAMGLAIASRRRWPWAALGVPLIGALYLTGSRSVLFAVAAGLAVTLILLVRRQRVARGVVVFAVVALVLAMTGYRWMSGRDLAGELAQKSMAVRLELVRTSLRIIELRPVFGVGVDRFFLLAGSHASPELHAMFPARLNPHNDFLRFGAELGLVGLGLFLWILADAGRRVYQALARENDARLAGLVGGLVAFLITGLVSNPLIVREVSYAFWIALGLAVGRSSGGSWLPPSGGRPRVGTLFRPVAWRWPLAALFVVVLAVSIPYRVWQELAGLDLSRVSYGLLDWGTNPDGTPARRTGPRATVFVHARARHVEIPLAGTLPSGGLQRVEVHVNGRLADRFEVGSDWHRARVVLPPERAQGSHRIDLFVSPTWVPAEVVGNDDWREVGVKVGKIQVLLGSE